MIAKLFSGAVVGLSAQPIEVEVDVHNGMPSIVIVGLPDTAVQESKERVKSALQSVNVPLPSQRVVVNLAPADLRKEGPAYDLPIAVGILQGMEIIGSVSEKWLFLGELALDGTLRHTKGILPLVIMAHELGFEKVFLPQINAREASLIEEVDVMPVTGLAELIRYLQTGQGIEPEPTLSFAELIVRDPIESDMQLVKGQEHVKRALEIAAAGGHNILLGGPPGSGKTMLARTVPSILPGLTLEESLEVTKIYSVSGLLPPGQALITNRPYRSPHHTTSRNALIGGGSWPRPGEISLAHRGVLFLDEFPEFPSHSLEALRQPLEDGIVTISRVQGTLAFPAQFILIAAMNPCPCGFAGDPIKRCTCSPIQIERYQKRISGPLLDRIDLHVQVPRVPYDKLADETRGEASVVMRSRIEVARARQQERFSTGRTARGGGTQLLVNADMGAKELRHHCLLDAGGEGILKLATERMHLSGRAYHRILKVARTIADLAEEETLLPEHVAEAIQYRVEES